MCLCYLGVSVNDKMSQNTATVGKGDTHISTKVYRVPAGDRLQAFWENKKKFLDNNKPATKVAIDH